MERFLVRSISTDGLAAAAKRPREENQYQEWIHPKRPATSKARTLLENAAHVRTQNRFAGLADNVKLDDKSSNTANVGHPKTRVPPIFADIKEGWTHQVIIDFITGFTKTFHLQYRSQGKIAIHCHDIEGHKALVEGLRNDNVFFHTFTRKEERSPKVVIKGLPTTVTEDLPTELAELGFNNAKITVLKSSKPNAKNSSHPPILVQLAPGGDVTKFKQIRYLSSCVVQIQKYTPKISGTQCYRCQRFGHSSRNCNFPERCVKCTGQHATKDCPKKDRTTPAQCCNCDDNHPANFSKCKERVKYLQHLNKKNEVNKLPPKMANYTGRSWAEVAHNVKTPLLDPPHHDEINIQDLLDETTTEMLDILKTIRDLKREFSKCTTMADKVILILTYLADKND
ncbi:hypothetical protein O0L34_g17477 [Tuta absoluta]|nr:hypothetical protein O0L34_g17477 [Tuta absoluta]